MLDKVKFELFDYLLIGLIYTVSSVISTILTHYPNKLVLTTLICLFFYTYYIIFRFYYN